MSTPGPAAPSTWLFAAITANLAVALGLAVTGTLMSPLSPVVAAIMLGIAGAAALLANYINIPTFKALGLHRLWRQIPPHMPT